MQALRIVNWWKFEMLKNGKLATAKTKMGALRIKPLVYVRFPVHGHTLSSDYRRMVKRAGPELAAACDGLYKALVGLAGNQVREYRGWVLDDRQRPLDPGQIAELLCLSGEKVSQILEVLTDHEVNFVNFLEFPEALRKSLNSNDLSGGSQIKKSGNNRENLGKIGIPLIEAEAEGFSKDKYNGFVTETEGEGVREKSGTVESQGAGGGEENAGPGAEGPGHLSEKDRQFEISRECKKAALELSQIIPPRTTSDVTTINDIYVQLQQRLIGGSPYPLFELSINTARQCWRGDKPIAMFVAAMKKPPFYYVPKKLSVIPGKFYRGKNTH